MQVCRAEEALDWVPYRHTRTCNLPADTHPTCSLCLKSLWIVLYVPWLSKSLVHSDGFNEKLMLSVKRRGICDIATVYHISIISSATANVLMADSLALAQFCQESSLTALLTLKWVLYIFATFTVGLRLYFRLDSRSGLGADDYVIFASWVSNEILQIRSILTSIQVVASVVGGFLTKWILMGLGSHLACLSDAQRLQVLKWSQLTQTVDVVGVGLVKLSVCLSVLRVLERASKNLARCIWVLIAFIVAIHLTQLVLFLTQCLPMTLIWEPQMHGKCFSLHVTYLAGYIRFGRKPESNVRILQLRHGPRT